MSILIVFILSLSIVRADTMDTYGMSSKEMEMMEEYKKGNINTDEFIELRKAKASEYGLLDYCDSTGSLTLTNSQNCQKSFRYGFFYVKFLFFNVVCVVYL